MRILLGGLAVAAMTAGSMSAALAAQCTMSNGGMMAHAMPHCTAMTGPVVWFVPSRKAYYLKGSSAWGKGAGTYVCRATAVARGGHPVNLNRGETQAQHHATRGSSMPMTMTMAPRPMPSGPSPRP